MRAGKAVALRPLESHHCVAVDDTAAMAVQRLPRWTHASPRSGIVGEVTRLIGRGLLLRLGLVVERIWCSLVPLLRCEPLVAPAHAVVGDERVYLHRGELLQVLFAVISRIGSDERVVREHVLHRRYHRHEELLFGTGAVRLGANDDLVLAVDRRHPGIALDHPLAGGHLGALVVGAVALADRAPHPSALPGVIGKPAAKLRRIALEALDALGCLRREIGFDRIRIFLAVPLQHRLRRRFEFLGLALEVGARAAAALRRVAGQLHPVDRKHLAPDQALPIADRQHGREHPGDVLSQGAHETGDCREVRARIPAQGNERHLLATRAFDRPAAHDPARVGEEHHLQEHRGRIRRGSGLVVPESRVEVRQIDLVIEQVIQRVFEGAGQQLPRQVDGQEPGAGIDVLVTGHGAGSSAILDG